VRLRDKHGFPIVPFKWRFIRNLLRRLFHSDMGVTWRRRHEWNIVCPDCRAYLMSVKETHSCDGKIVQLRQLMTEGWPKPKPKVKRKTIGQAVADDEIKVDISPEHDNI